VIKKILNFLLIFAILFNFFSLLSSNKEVYQRKFITSELENLYNQSQFAPNPNNRIKIINDDDLYAYAGWHYLKTGNLEQINIEHPPLGKYFIGLSILLFHNQNVGQIFWGSLFLILLYLLSLKITHNFSLSLIIILIFSRESLFQEQLVYSFLDLTQGVFLLIFLLTSLNNKKLLKINLFIQGLSLGAIASIKYPTIALVALFTLAIYYLFQKEPKIAQKLTFIVITTIILFLLTYLPFFYQNHSIKSFFQLQLQALKIHLFHVGNYPKGQVFNVLFFNRWLSWWGNKSYVKTEYWNFLWPILTVNFSLSLIKLKNNLLIKFWSGFYLIFLSLRLFFPRYLLLLLPFFYLEFSNNIILLYNYLNKRNPLKNKL